MGRIKKAAGPKHEATVVSPPTLFDAAPGSPLIHSPSQSPAISEFVATGVNIHTSLLSAHVRSFPQGWPFPRGDLYHWIPLLNRFDSILEAFINEYGLNDGPQSRPFGRKILATGVKSEDNSADCDLRGPPDLDGMGYAPDGDCELIQVILKHSQTLLENCGNRSLYNSSDRLGDLLNTTNLSLLSATLRYAFALLSAITHLDSESQMQASI